MNKGQIIILVALGAFALWWGAIQRIPATGGSPKTGARDICAGITPEKISRAMKLAGQIGLLPGRIGEITEVDERVWAELPRDTKTAAALIVYCGYTGNTLILRGWRDGETKATLINGNYLD